ncbi:MAG: hypothetical protein GY926_16645 [bacterium]|nr:hypothetical protein [bacterium]
MVVDGGGGGFVVEGGTGTFVVGGDFASGPAESMRVVDGAAELVVEGAAVAVVVGATDSGVTASLVPHAAAATASSEIAIINR